MNEILVDFPHNVIPRKIQDGSGTLPKITEILQCNPSPVGYVIRSKSSLSVERTLQG